MSYTRSNRCYYSTRLKKVNPVFEKSWRGVKYFACRQNVK